MPTDANKTDGMTSSKSASFITDKKTVVLFLLILLDFKVFKISVSISFTYYDKSSINASGSCSTVMSTTCVPLTATHYYEL